MTNYRVICHHGIKGQKWGVRRFQNEDGTRTEEGKRRERSGMSDNTKSTLKNVAKGAAIGIGVAAAAYGAYKLGPTALKKVPLDKLGEYAKKGKDRAATALKNSAKSAVEGFKEGVKEGIRDAPKRLGKTLVTGAALLVGKKIIDQALGEDQARRIARASNPKKIYSLWNNEGDTNSGSKKDDEED